MTAARPGDAEVITSPANPAIKLVRALGRRDRRAAARAFVIEGVRGVHDALQAGATPRLLLVREDRADELLPALPLPPDIPVRRVERRLFDRLSDVQTPQGILAVFPIPDLTPDWTATEALALAAPLVLVIDRLRDPGNLGTLLRTAAGAGVSAVYTTPQSVDLWHPKVVRAGMGAHLRLPLLPLDAEARAALHERLPLRAVARADAPRSYDDVDWTGPAALVIGGEAEGVSEELNAWASEAVAIPLAAGVESLNAAMAGTVILFEAARQRRLTGAAQGPKAADR